MKNKNMKKILGYVIPGVIGVCAALIASIFFGFVTVSGRSMQPTFNNGKYLITQKMFNEYKQGDIVIAHINFQDKNEDIIKRIIAVAGQTVEIKHGKVIVDNKELNEDYIKEQMIDQTFDKITIPEGYVYVMGDNRNNSLDSRNLGPISLNNLKGKVLFH